VGKGDNVEEGRQDLGKEEKVGEGVQCWGRETRRGREEWRGTGTVGERRIVGEGKEGEGRDEGQRKEEERGKRTELWRGKRQVQVTTEADTNQQPCPVSEDHLVTMPPPLHLWTFLQFSMKEPTKNTRSKQV